MVVVEDLVRDAGAVDAADDLDVGAAIGFRKIAGETAVERDEEQDLKEGSWNVVALEFDFVLVAALDGCCEDCVDGEQEEVMVTSGGIRGRCVRGGGGEESFPCRRGERTFARSCGRGGTLASGRGRSEGTSSQEGCRSC